MTTKKDRRYSIGLEWCGQPTQRYITRFCGDWVGHAGTEKEARVLADGHHATLFKGKSA